jgi:sulfite dehydrogenase (quinone) subunit SoeB
MTQLPASTAKKLGLVIDLDTCVGCHACVISCKGWNTENYGAPLSDQDAYGADPSGTSLTACIPMKSSQRPAPPN